jgi:hypothetical protein
VQGRGLLQLGGMKIKELKLDGTDVSDSELALLGYLSELTVLDLSRTAISGDGLASLAALPNLRGITLDNTDLTDEELQLLTTFPSLRGCRCYGTRVTLRGVTDAEIKGLSIDCEDKSKMN